MTKIPDNQREGREIIVGTDPRSIPGSQFSDPDLAAAFKCTICSIGNISRIPLTPLKTDKCVHFYCPLCIENWRSSEFVNSSSCPVQSCRIPFEDVELHVPAGLLRDIHHSLSLHCKYISNGCDCIVNIGSYIKHIKSCKYRVSKKTGHPQNVFISVIL